MRRECGKDGVFLFKHVTQALLTDASLVSEWKGLFDHRPEIVVDQLYGEVVNKYLNMSCKQLLSDQKRKANTQKQEALRKKLMKRKDTPDETKGKGKGKGKKPYVSVVCVGVNARTASAVTPVAPGIISSVLGLKHMKIFQLKSGFVQNVGKYFVCIS
jgi:hypothetical protein